MRPGTLRSTVMALLLGMSALPGVTFAADSAASRLGLRPDLAAKAQPRLLERFAAGETREMLVELEDSLVQEMARGERKRLALHEDDEGIRELKREGYRVLRDGLLEALPPGRVALRKGYRNVPVLSVEVPDANALAQLLAQPEVRSAYANESYEMQLAQSLSLIGQPLAASRGGTGAGTAVCVIDTGVEFGEAVFGACAAAGDPGCRVVAAQEFAPQDNQRDSVGHGTNVAGIVAGTAPETEIAALDVFRMDSDGVERAPADVVLDAIDWCIDNRAAFGFVAMNLSLGIPTENQGDCESFADAAFREAREAGIEPIVAAGNDGFSGGIAEPACSPFAISVGAVYDASFTGTRSYTQAGCSDTDGKVDQITCFSNSGTGLDLLAPGAQITAGGTTGSTRSGTSMAAPHVAGAWAVMRQARPELGPAQVLEVLRLTGKNITDPRNGLTRPRIRLGVAIDFEPIAGEAEANDWFGTSTVAGDFDGDGRDDAAIGAPYEDVGSLANAGSVNVIYGSVVGLDHPGNQLWSQNTAGVPGVSEANDLFGYALAAGDFDRDGYDDLAIGTPNEDEGSVVDSGYLVVLRGSPNGLTASGAQAFHQDMPGVADVLEAGDRFGLVLASGDLDRDGYADLAIGAPGEDVGAASDAGGVNVLYGSVQGLSTKYGQIWHQDVAGVTGVAESYDRFGASLAIGDFDRDGFGDLAIGAYDEDLSTASGSMTNAGFVHVLHGTSVGLSASRSQGWSQESTGVSGAVESGDRFGVSLAAGDFDHNGLDDLAIGASDEGLVTASGNVARAGHVNVLYGTTGGLSGSGSQGWNQDSTGIAGAVEANDRFGSSLAAGDFNRDGYDDLAIGVLDEDLATSSGNVADAGYVNVIYGSASKLSATGNQGWSQGSSGIAGNVESGDRFGYQLSTGDFDGNGIADLLCGIPQENFETESGTLADVGVVHVIYGSTSRLTASRNKQWHQDL